MAWIIMGSSDRERTVSMPFNQQGQKVSGNQYNAEGDIVIGGEAKIEDMVKLLETLKQQIVQARQQGIIGKDISADAEHMVNQAVQQTQKPQPNRGSIVSYLNAAKGLVEGVASAGSIVATLVHAVEIAQRLF